MKKLISLEEAAKLVKDDMTIMVGGFLGVGSPERILKELIKNNVKNLTLIANDTSFPGQDYGDLVVHKMVKKVIVSHIGTNRETGNQMHSKELEVVLVPQGTLAEQIRAYGAGLGAVITPTGLGTVVEEGKEILEVDGKRYIVEKPLRADIALIRASKADKNGNLIYDKSARNFNPIMAMAADIVIVEADEIVEVGELDPNFVMTPHIFVNYIVGDDK
ncbi:3-oxoacid CoA-transferase subunit A [Clostridiaceae bacterium HSG29]|nr:3-oxoacid CoA-transferase subunit A [Clostridiaceae bacterium HSG29]